MSDESEKTCPLCAEEMDLTDQQLKPCKCGYEVLCYFNHLIFFCKCRCNCSRAFDMTGVILDVRFQC